MSRQIGWLALVVGVILLLLAVFAAQLGLGGTTFGLKHLLVLIVGAVAVVGGLIVAMRGKS